MSLPEQLRPVLGSARGKAPSAPFVYDEVQELEWDGHRYEIVDGVLVVNPAPRFVHQRAVRALTNLLEDAGSPEHVAVQAPFDWRLHDESVFEPDVLVARRADVLDRYLPVPPVIVVEVLSPSTRRFDLYLKRSAYAEGGAPEYWIVDPDEPSLLVLRLGPDGAYVDHARVTGDDAYEAAEPFGLRAVPSDLIR